MGSEGYGALDGIARGVDAVGLVSIELQDHGQRIGGVDVVVDNEHTPRRTHQPLTARLLRSASLDARQADLEAAAFAQTPASRSDLTAMHLDQALHDGKADAESPLRPIERPVSLYEQLEHTWQQLLGETDPVIADLDDRLLPFRPALDANVPAGIGVLGGVRQYVDHALHEPRAIAIDVQRELLGDNRDVVPLLTNHRRHRLRGLSDDACQIDRLALQLNPALSDPRDIQQIVDQTRQVSRLAPNHADRFLRTAVVR